jgi:outer membrane protein OmpA-like peptidoglycan-associated protein
VLCWIIGLFALAALRTACAQPAIVLDLQVRVEEVTGAVLGLSVPVEAAVAAGEEVGIRETVSEIRVNLPADILFDFDKANIRPSAASTLHEAADLIRTRANGFVQVEGHTDGKGSAAYNQRLSKQRADAVRLWLIQNEGLRSVTFVTVGFAANHPVASNTRPDGSDDPEGRQRNRRVELVLQKR